MKDMKNLIYIFSCASLLLFQSCRPSEQERMERLLNQWHGKEIQFPSVPKFAVYGEDTMNINSTFETEKYKTI